MFERKNMKISFIENSETGGLEHKLSSGSHPENGSRLKVILEWLRSEVQPEDILKAKSARKEEVLAIHEEELFRLVEKTEKVGAIYFSPDNRSNKFTYEASITAAGAAVTAVEKATPSHHYFVLVRPPGHHATSLKAQGFCYFNNIAIGVKYLLSTGKAKKVAIYDFDNHFGNGTYAVFENEPKVLYISSHAHPSYCYPGTGYIDQIGRGEAEGTKINLPLMPSMGDQDLLKVVDEVVLPALEAFKPDLLAISAGFDAYKRDPIGMLGFSEGGFMEVGTRLLNFVKNKKIPLVHMLEGGYNVSKLPDLLKAYLSPYKESWTAPPADQNKVSKSTTEVAKFQKRLINEYL